MQEKIGSYLLNKTGRSFSMSFVPNRKFYFDIIFTIVKILFFSLVLFLLKFHQNIMTLYGFIPFLIFFVIILYFLIILFSIINKPHKNFLVYSHSDKTLKVKETLLKSKSIRIQEGHTIYVEKTIEKARYFDGNSRPANYFIMVYLKRNANEKDELFRINLSNIISNSRRREWSDLDCLVNLLVKRKLCILLGVDYEEKIIKE
jgi:hypothetical protein